MKCIVIECINNRKNKTNEFCAAHEMQIYRHGKIIKKRIGQKNCYKKYKYTYTSYRAMKQRCSPKNQDYKYYKDIKICERWDCADGWDNFFDDMGERPLNLTLERINNGGDYSKENCKWATRYEQSQNTRQKIKSDRNPLKIKALKHGIRYASIWQRSYDRKISLEEALDIMIDNKINKKFQRLNKSI